MMRKNCRRAVVAILASLALSGCVEPVVTTPRAVPTAPVPARLNPDTAVRNFVTVSRRMEPLIEQECSRRTRGLNCDFLIVVDDNPKAPPNAFQTIDRNGRPVVGFTLALIADARNRDEIAFVLGHEAAHHIAGHIPRTQQSAMTGALIGGIAAAIAGVDVDAGQDFGATVGSRRFSKDFELEADALGTVITARAGFDPVRGAEYFARIPDPGNRFLGTHPPNAQRMAIVRQTAARL